jgi:hypothetical protein
LDKGPPAGVAEFTNDFAFDKVSPEPEKCSGAVIDYKDATFASQVFDEGVITNTLNDPFGVDEFEFLNSERSILAQRPV